MAGGGIFFDGEWLRVGSRVVLMRPGYVGMLGTFKGRGPRGKLVIHVNGESSFPRQLYVTRSEIQRAAPQTARGT